VTELIFFVLIVLFSILESVARKRKEGQEKGGGAEERRGDGGSGRPGRQRGGERSAPDPHSEREGAPVSEDSTGMIPDDLWAELEDMLGAGSRQPGGEEGREVGSLDPGGAPSSAPGEEAEPVGYADRTSPSPSEPSPRPAGVPSTATSRKAPRPPVGLPSPGEPHPVHRSHIGFGTDPSERAAVEAAAAPTAKSPLQHEKTDRLRAVLRGERGREAVREAVLLREILGPPVALRGPVTGGGYEGGED